METVNILISCQQLESERQLQSFYILIFTQEIESQSQSHMPWVHVRPEILPLTGLTGLTGPLQLLHLLSDGYEKHTNILFINLRMSS